MRYFDGPLSINLPINEEIGEAVTIPKLAVPKRRSLFRKSTVNLQSQVGVMVRVGLRFGVGVRVRARLELGLGL